MRIVASGLVVCHRKSNVTLCNAIEYRKLHVKLPTLHGFKTQGFAFAVFFREYFKSLPKYLILKKNLKKTGADIVVCFICTTLSM